MATQVTASPNEGVGFPAPHEVSARLWGPCYALLVALAIVGYPLVAAAMQIIGGHERTVSVAFRGYLLCLALIVMVFSGHLRSSLPKGALGIATLLWIALLLRYAWDATVVRLPMDLPWMDYGLMIVGTVLVPAMAAMRTCDVRALDQAARLIQLFGVVAAVLVVVGLAEAARELLLGGRWVLEALNPISIGHLGVTLTIVSVVAPERSSAPRTAFQTVMDFGALRWICGLVGIAVALGSASRGPAMALVGVLLLRRFSYDVGRHGLRGVVRTGLIVASVTAVLAGGIFLLVKDVTSIPLISRVLAFSVDQAVSGRMDLIRGALQQFEGSPLVGSSFVELVQRYYPHNIVVEVLMTNGVVGFALLASLLVLVAAAGLRLLRTPFAWIALLCAQYVVGSMTSGSLYFDGQFWVLSAVVLGVDWSLKKRMARGGLQPVAESGSRARLPTVGSDSEDSDRRT